MDYMIYIKIFSFQPCLLLDVPYQIHIWARSPPFPQLDFGLFLPLEPTIHFSYSSAVSLFKSRHFRLHEPAIPFFPTGQRFLPLKNT